MVEPDVEPDDVDGEEPDEGEQDQGQFHERGGEPLCGTSHQVPLTGVRGLERSRVC